MEFFGFSNSDSLSPLGMLIRSATDSLLIGPDWSKNMDICDMIDSEGKETATLAIRVLLRRLHESDPNTVYLSLILTEACMKNCGVKFASSIDRQFMDEITTIAKGAKGKKCSEESLRLIQQWGKTFEHQRNNLSVFPETYISLKTKGMRFPAIEDTQDIRESNATSISSPTLLNSSHENLLSQFKPTNHPEFSKLEKDLRDVMEKGNLCRELMMHPAGDSVDYALSEVLGFLEACKDRMMDLIEAGSHGLLGEQLFAECLRVNDFIIKTLEAEKAGILLESENYEELQSQRPNAAYVEPLLDLGEGGGLSTSTRKASPTPVKSIGKVGAMQMDDDEDDEFGSLLQTKTVNNKPSPASSSSASASARPSPISPIPPPRAATTTAATITAATPSKASESLLDLSDSSSSSSTAVPAVVDDLDFLNITTTTSPSSSSTNNTNPKPDADLDFDDFLNSLNEGTK